MAKPMLWLGRQYTCSLYLNYLETICNLLIWRENIYVHLRSELV